MATPVRAVLTHAALLLAATSLLHAEGGVWGAQIGAAQPSAGSKQWVGTTTGVALDIAETYALGSSDAVRMRFGYYTFKASSSAPATVTPPAGAAGSYPASTTNELFAFSYGAEYLRNLPARFYVLGGLGATYVSATRKGTFDLTGAGYSALKANYTANNFVPYLCLGLGWQISTATALEARWQTSPMKAQTRPFDLSAGTGAAVGTVAFDKLNVSSLTLGLAITF